MNQETQFSYEDFWEQMESELRPRPAVAEDGWVDVIELEEPAPPWVRLSSRRDPFPPCAALAAWPQNYPVGELADLTDAEAAEEDPDRFVFSDGEMEAWAQIVSEMLDDTMVVGLVGSSFARVGKEAPPRGHSEVKQMARTNQTEGAVQGEKAPPVWKTAAGGVQLAVWRNPAPSGGFFHTVTLDRRFKRKDGQWDSSASLRLNDIPKAILVLQKAYEKIATTDASAGEGPEGEETPSSPTPAQSVPSEVQRYLATLRPDLFGPAANAGAAPGPGSASS